MRLSKCLSVRKMIGNTDFDKAQTVEKVLHDMQHYVFLHVVTNLTGLSS